MYLSRAIFRSSALSIVNQLNIAFLLFSPSVYAAAQCWTAYHAQNSC
jgi:hypothetical protein